MLKGKIFCFLFFLSLNLFSASLKVEEEKNFLNIKISLTENEIELLSSGKRADGFNYFLNPNQPALTHYSFYIALPPSPEVSFSYTEKFEIRNEKLPLLSEDGSLKYGNYELSEDWFPSKEAKIFKSGFIRQVPFIIINFYPIQISKKGMKVNKEIEININYNCNSCLQIIEESIFSNLYNSIFLNNWKNKGVDLEKNLKSIWSIPPSTYTIYKIPVERDGIYALTYDFLDQNTDWFLPSIDPRKIHLYNLGQEIPIYITGESDGQFNINDVLYFYGEYYKDENLEGVWQKGDFTDKNIYWLVIEETQGLRMQTKDVAPINNYNLVQNYLFEKHFEENLIESSFVPYQDSDHWLWDYIRWYSYDQSHTIGNFYLFLPGISNSPSGNCTLKYEVRGITYRQQNPDHHIKVRINGNLVDEFYFDDFYFYQREVNFPQSFLGGSGNQTIDLSVEVPNPSEIGVDGDGMQVNWFEIKYLRDYIANNNEIFFSLSSGNLKTIISEFTSNNIILMDITAPKNPKFCINGQIIEINPSNFTLTFEDSIPTNNKYISMVPLTLNGLIEYQQTNLLDENPEYLIITPKLWLSSSVLNNYLNFRQGQGLTVKAVAVEDIYDQFNFGIFSPFPIKTYLQNLYNKSNPPKLTFVLLIGDAEYDYKDYKGDGNLNFIPTLMKSNTGYSDSIYNPYAYYSFENYFGTFLGGDNLPEILIGRIPAKSQEEMETVLTKIKNYETNLPDKNYLKNFFHISDCRDGFYFKLAQETNSSYLQTPFSLENMYLTDLPYNQNPGSCNSYYIDIDQDNNGIKDTIDKFNGGKGFVNFIGHGSFLLWSDFLVLKSPEDMGLLSNTNFPSVVLNSNCYTGSFYHSFFANSILEDLLIRSTGASSTFGPGTFMFLFQTNIPIEPIYKSFFGYDKERNLALLYYQSFLALESLGNDRLTQGFVALGDPKTNYPVQTPLPPLNLNLQYTSCREINISWQAPDENKYTYNIYRATNQNGPFTKIFLNYDMLSYIDVDLIYGNTYYYFITAVDSDGFEGKRTEVKSIYANPCPPNPPQNFQCIDSTWGGRINFTWVPSNEPEVENFRIYYGYSSGNYTIYKDTGNVTSYQIGGLTDRTSIFSSVSAWNSFNLESQKSNEVSCTATNTNGWKPPKMVYPLLLTRNGTNPILHFNLPSQNIWGDTINQSNLSLCTIYRSQNPNFNPNRSSSSPDKIGTILPSSCNENQCLFEDNSSPSNAFYYVTCQTPNNEESSISKNPPNYPVNLNYKKIKGKYNINWEPVLTDIYGNPINISFYEIYRSLNPNFLPDFKDKTNRVGTSTTNSYTDTPPDSQEYYYKVLAFDQKGNNGPY